MHLSSDRLCDSYDLGLVPTNTVHAPLLHAIESEMSLAWVPVSSIYISLLQAIDDVAFLALYVQEVSKLLSFRRSMV